LIDVESEGSKVQNSQDPENYSTIFLYQRSECNGNCYVTRTHLSVLIETRLPRKDIIKVHFTV
jgi:hypothetical protein